MQQCASCHGKDGMGVDGEYDEPLVGERTLRSLARKIEKTMPEDNVGACVGEDAKQVAAYIYDAFSRQRPRRAASRRPRT